MDIQTDPTEEQEPEQEHFESMVSSSSLSHLKQAPAKSFLATHHLHMIKSQAHVDAIFSFYRRLSFSIVAFVSLASFIYARKFKGRSSLFSFHFIVWYLSLSFSC